MKQINSSDLTFRLIKLEAIKQGRHDPHEANNFHCGFSVNKFSQWGNLLNLVVNPAKSDIVVFHTHRVMINPDFQIAGCEKSVLEEAKYLGVIFDRKGQWKTQKSSLVARCRMALGRCKMICRSLNITSVKTKVEIFDMFVSSISRYSLGAWGPTGGNLEALDKIFCEFIRSTFKLPGTACARGILMQFGRRCASCDAYFLASIQIARGLIARESIWGKILSVALTDNRVKWTKKMRVFLSDTGFQSAVLNSPEVFLAERRLWGTRFAVACHEKHLRFSNGRSSDFFRANRPFGMYPVIFDSSTDVGRDVLAFVLSCWKWAFEGGRDLPAVCSDCDLPLNGPHLLFHCGRTQCLREEFERVTLKTFELDVLNDEASNYEVLRVFAGARRLIARWEV